MQGLNPSMIVFDEMAESAADFATREMLKHAERMTFLTKFAFMGMEGYRAPKFEPAKFYDVWLANFRQVWARWLRWMTPIEYRDYGN